MTPVEQKILRYKLCRLMANGPHQTPEEKREAYVLVRRTWIDVEEELANLDPEQAEEIRSRLKPHFATR